MPVSISLAHLVTTAHSLHLWPAEFRALIAKLAMEPDEATAWLVLADWLNENEEPELERTCRWVAGRGEVLAQRDTWDRWVFRGLPTQVRAGDDPPGDTRTLAGAIAVLAERLRRTREAVT